MAIRFARVAFFADRPAAAADLTLEQFKKHWIIESMNEAQAVTSLAALAHPQRLAIFRLLVVEGTNGLPASEIAEAVGAAPTAASFHLKELERAGLIRGTRDGRYIRYAIHVEGMRQLLAYLTEDCCRGQPELCGSSIKKVRTPCKSKGGCR
jgi:ArsR family transcriptional regulator